MNQNWKENLLYAAAKCTVQQIHCESNSKCEIVVEQETVHNKTFKTCNLPVVFATPCIIDNAADATLDQLNCIQNQLSCTSIGEVRPSWAKDLQEGKTYDCWYDQADKVDDSCICQSGAKSSVRGLLFAGQRNFMFGYFSLMIGLFAGALGVLVGCICTCRICCLKKASRYRYGSAASDDSVLSMCSSSASATDSDDERIEKENKKKVKAKKTKNQTTRGMLSLRTNSASFGNDEYDRIITPTKTRDKNVFFST